ncbi:MAG: GH92 family glycosyl hydrolase [Mangrovibacterium sp.]
MKVLILLTSIFITLKLSTAQDLTQYVDPRMGVIGEGSCSIGPQLPFGSVNPGPDTPEGGTDGYNPKEKIRGFSQLHVTGTGGPGKYGQFLISPQIGLNVKEDGHDYEKSNEEASVDHYKVSLTDKNIVCELSPTEHAVIYNFTFPESDSAFILIDLCHNIPGDIMHHKDGTSRGGYAERGSLYINTNEKRITGEASFWGGWSAEPFDAYFSLEFSKSVQRFGTWKDSTVTFNKDFEFIEKKASRIGAFIGFKTKQGEQITIKLAVSLKSPENAALFLKQEIPGWEIEKIREEARKKWDHQLSRIVVEGADDGQKTLFYSSLYQALRMPRNRSGDNPKWDSPLPYWDDHFCVWDTWRTVFPLNLLINESMVRDNILAFIDRYEHNGRVLDAFIAGNDRVYQWSEVELPYYFHNQGGDNVDNIIADAFVKKVDGINWERAYKILKYNAENSRTPAYLVNDRGWVPFRTYEYALDCSRTLEFAYNDFCASQMALGLNKPDDHERYLTRSSRWNKLWNNTLTSMQFKGFICPKRMNSTWVKYNPRHDRIENSPGVFDRSFYEGNSWTYSFFVPHQFNKLIKLMGGPEKYAERLHFALKNRLVNLSNEPGFLAPFSFIYAARPDLTSYWVGENRKEYILDGFPGEEDSGAMGSWYVFAAMGFFPNAGQDLYLISGPVFPKIVLTRENGKQIVIEAENASPGNRYVQSAMLNGQPLNRAWIKHEEIANGALLQFKMGDKPSKWGIKDLPPVK